MRNQEIDYRIRSNNCFLTCGYTRSRIPAWGLAGGQPSAVNYIQVRRASGKIYSYAFVTDVPLNEDDATGNGATRPVASGATRRPSRCLHYASARPVVRRAGRDLHLGPAISHLQPPLLPQRLLAGCRRGLCGRKRIVGPAAATTASGKSRRCTCNGQDGRNRKQYSCHVRLSLISRS
jgi:hypothetical protein